MAAFGSRLPGLKRGILATGSALKSSPISARFLPPGMEPIREWPGALYLGWAGTENDGNGSALIDNEILFAVSILPGIAFFSARSSMRSSGPSASPMVFAEQTSPGNESSIPEIQARTVVTYRDTSWSSRRTTLSSTK
jgi:hypothetical protein